MGTIDELTGSSAEFDIKIASPEAIAAFLGALMNYSGENQPITGVNMLEMASGLSDRIAKNYNAFNAQLVASMKSDGFIDKSGYGGALAVGRFHMEVDAGRPPMSFLIVSRYSGEKHFKGEPGVVDWRVFSCDGDTTTPILDDSVHGRIISAGINYLNTHIRESGTTSNHSHKAASTNKDQGEETGGNTLAGSNVCIIDGSSRISPADKHGNTSEAERVFRSAR